MSVNLTLFFFCDCRCTRSSSVVCDAQACHTAPETTASLPGLACPGWRDRPGLMSPSSPFPLLTSLGLLLETITSVHKGLSRKVRRQDEFTQCSAVLVVMLGKSLQILKWDTANDPDVAPFLLLSSAQFTALLLSQHVIGYLQSCIGASASLTPSRAWLLRHEHHLLYLLLRLSLKLVGFTCKPKHMI